MNKSKFNKLTKEQLAYLSGFLEGNDCILVQIVKGQQYKYNHIIRFSIVFYQKKDKKWFFIKLKKLIGIGLIKTKKDGMMEYSITGKTVVEKFLNQLLPFLILKKTLAILVLKIINKVNCGQTEVDFLEACKLVDKVAEFTYSKKRKNTSLSVLNSLTLPVETEK